MAIKHLDSIFIDDKEKIKFPEDSTHYRCKSGKIKFFKVNPTPSQSMEKRPEDAEYIYFKHYRRNFGNINYGETIFYNKEGNILKQ